MAQLELTSLRRVIWGLDAAAIAAMTGITDWKMTTESVTQVMATIRTRHQKTWPGISGIY